MPAGAIESARYNVETPLMPLAWGDLRAPKLGPEFLGNSFLPARFGAHWAGTPDVLRRVRMTMEIIRHMGRRIRRARELVGLTQEEAARRLGITREYLSMIETGKRRPPLSLLSKMAELFGCPVSWFYEQQEPTGSFQLLLRKGEETLSPEGMRGLLQFCHLCDAIAELREILGRPLPELPLYDDSPKRGERLEALARRIARAERERLGLGDDPVPELPNLLEACGIAVVRLPLPQNELGGAMAYEREKGGFILVNVADLPSRRLWTVAHEYAHLIRDRTRGYTLDSGEDIRENEEGGLRRDERFFLEYFANKFAAHFLMPEETVRRLVEDVYDRRLDAFSLVQLRRTFGVSYHALLIRLKNLDYLDEEDVRRWQAVGLSALEQFLFGRSEEEMKPEAPSLLLKELALQAAAEGEITISHCAELLGLSPPEVEDILAEIGEEDGEEETSTGNGGGG